jgi:phosphopantothenoylcysteine decarboxylase/phosphopantothenate--cysteine ligase
VRLLGPAEGDQACGDVGAGRMLEPLEIATALLETPGRLRLRSLAGLKVLVTAGPTREPIDPVRYITNRSSGKMGYALAAAAREAGADVVLVSGPVSLPTPAGVRRVDVETADELYAKVLEEIGGVDIFVGCAAVSDYRPEKVAPQKIKRTSAELELTLVRSPDTLASVAKLPSPPFTVGFAAETHDVVRHAREKLENKRIDMIAANQVGRDCGFDRETNSLTVFWHGGELVLGEGSKPALARRLVELIAERYHASRRDARPTPTSGAG